jgi:AbiV family abortive infection protein
MSRYSDGELDLEQLKLGRLVVLKNAEELVVEAEILYENKRWARSFFLSQAASEELGKYMMVVSAIAFVVGGGMNWELFWKRFRNHRAKLFKHMRWTCLLSCFFNSSLRMILILFIRRSLKSTLLGFLFLEM